ncbi:MAG: LysR family transcriptional regulator [Paraburkholderia sp.]|jgi:DNA-binding transcriptional LysR family regulator|uniref:LysR family transcriptional regulator n=1 Tax=Paraburkholderia sp. TaxID=1926495 RepID=UPI00397A5190
MNLATFDLNLLVAFDALMMERSVTRAGEKLCLSQPAMSANLRRLRELLRDELFERVGGGMRPTPRAIALAAPIRKILQQVQTTLDPSPFDPRIANRRFRIATNDLGVVLFLPPLCQTRRHCSSGITFELLQADEERAFELLESGEADIAIGPVSSKHDHFHSVLLYDAPFACAMRANHPLARKVLTPEEFAGAPQISVAQHGDPVRVVDRILAEAGLKRHIAFTVPHYLAVPFLLATTDLLAVIPTKLVERFGATEGIVIAEAAFARLTVPTLMLWVSAANDDSGNAWLRSTMLKIAADYQVEHWTDERRTGA